MSSIDENKPFIDALIKIKRPKFIESNQANVLIGLNVRIFVSSLFMYEYMSEIYRFLSIAWSMW